MATHRMKWLKCNNCGKSKEHVEKLSARGYCPECSEYLLVTAEYELASHEGKVYDRWLLGIATAIAGLIGVSDSHRGIPVKKGAPYSRNPRR